MRRFVVSGGAEVALLLVVAWFCWRLGMAWPVFSVLAALLVAGAVAGGISWLVARGREPQLPEIGSSAVRLLAVGPTAIQVVKELRLLGVEDWRPYLRGTASLPAIVVEGLSAAHAAAAVELLVSGGAQAEVVETAS